MLLRLFSILVFLAAAALGQSLSTRTINNHNSWNTWFGHHAIAGEFGAHTEVQFRRSGWGETSQQLLMRYGVTYDLTPSLRAVVGYGYIRTFPYGEAPAAAPFRRRRPG